MVKFNEDAIREAAYYNWQNAGCPNGQDEYFWTMAIEQLSNCNNKNSCSNSSCSSKKSSSKNSNTKTTKSAACKTAASSKKSK